MAALNQPRRTAVTREALVFLAFCFFTALVTWPYAAHLRNAVADPGDPYLVSWILWWDYHQTFTDPLNLFHSNLFYPFRYTLAFSEHCYGIALLFFPLFALGAQPLTVHAVAIFLGFATCGYGAFRLTRTLTGSTGAGWIAGIIFAFVPFRFGMMSHLPYLFSAWIPLLFEALVLFSRERSRGRAVWLGVAFFMTGLTTITWLTLSIVPFAVSATILLTRYGLWRDWAFWRRGAMALGLASVALLPFLLPYSAAAKLYNFQRSVDEVKGESARAFHWLSADNRNRFWRGLGDHLPQGGRFRLFPGLLPILLSLAAWFLAVCRVAPGEKGDDLTESPTGTRWLWALDALAILALIIAVPVIGTARNGTLHTIYTSVTSERALGLLLLVVIARFCLAYPQVLRVHNANLIETLRSDRRSDAFWIGLALTVIGFCYSLGWNFFFYRILYDVLPFFKSMRVAVRGSMFAYLGLAILSGLGAKCLAEMLRAKIPRLRPALVFAVLATLLLFELNASRLRFTRGDVDPDAVTLRLKETSMRGGVVVLPANGAVNHRHLLRAADHKKPMIVGTSGFNSPYEEQIEWDTRGGPIPAKLMRLFEDAPASYVVIENHLIPPERRIDYETFLARAVVAGRLRFINRFDGRADLYAVVKTEPQAKTEAPLPFELQMKDWAALVKEDPVNLLGQFRSWSQAVYRLHVASYGAMPRYAEFLPDVESLGIGVVASSLDEQQPKLEENLRELAERPQFQERFNSMTNDEFVDALSANAHVMLAPAERAALIDKLNGGALARPQVLLAIVNNPVFAAKEQNRSLVLLHYFGYLHRNPDDLPDTNMEGFNFWLKEVETTGEVDRLTRAFMASIEHREKTRK
ncbi:MAG TPA: hypothetical protein VEX43_01770 [Chthoniobacterales bacterium]|nr:hypothetical protein [Chthoniobacterales bacterium]